MSHRVRKLLHKLKHDGLMSAGGFVLHDLYFRALATLAFPFGRRRARLGNGRDPLGEFVAAMDARGDAAVLELGSRAVSDRTMRHRFAAGTRHTGLDVHMGPNVDVVGDAHALGQLFPPGRFDGVFSISVFEHLLMPWVVAVETNKVLKMGGLTLVSTHPAWPPHELPWDFWRFQENAFCALFNRATGFEILSTVTSTPARIFPLERSSHLLGTTKTIVPMGVAVLARKIGPVDSRLAWPLIAADVTPTEYPTAAAAE